MTKLSLPKKPYKGIKIYCKKCRLDNPKCKHFDHQVYKVRVHIPGTKNSIKSKILDVFIYKDAVKEAINFEKELETRNFEISKSILDMGNDYSVIDAITKYRQYLNGESGYTHLKKNITDGYLKECMRFCNFFANSLKERKDIKKMRVKEILKEDVSIFYSWAENRYKPKTFNKCLNGVKVFFDFLINIEEVNMKNPFREYTRRNVVKSNVETITKEEFTDILKAVDEFSPLVVLGGKGETKNMYKSYLKDGFRLFLLTGARREEVVDLSWSDIFITVNDVKFFRIQNLKVERSQNKDDICKYIPINSDLMNLLFELGYDERKKSSDYILYPERKVKSSTIMDSLSKSFTHYKNGAGIEKNVSLKTLRKTYISWVHKVMQKDTGILTSHSTKNILESYYLDPKILSIVEKGALEIKIFG